MTDRAFTVEKWTDKEEAALVRIRIQHHHLFTGHHGNAGTGWKTVQDSLNKEGIFRSNISKFKRKWGDIVQQYKAMKQPSAYTTGQGTEDSRETAIDWDLFVTLDDFFCGKHVMNPPAIMDTSLSAANIASSKASTGRSHYLNLGCESTDESTDDSQLCLLDHDYISGEVEVQSDSPPKIKSPEKSSKRAVAMVTTARRTGCYESSGEEDDPPVEVSVKATATSRSKFHDFYNVPDKRKKLVPKRQLEAECAMTSKKLKEQKDKKKDDNEDWMKNFLISSEAKQDKQHADLIEVLRAAFAPKKDQ